MVRFSKYSVLLINKWGNYQGIETDGNSIRMK
jgi:hypothetical protein